MMNENKKGIRNVHVVLYLTHWDDKAWCDLCLSWQNLYVFVDYQQFDTGDPLHSQVNTV